MLGEGPDSPFAAVTAAASSEDVTNSSRVRLLESSHHFPTFGSSEHSLVHSFDRLDSHDAGQSPDHLAFGSQHSTHDVGPTQSFVQDSNGTANGSSMASSALAGKSSSLAALGEQRVLWQQEEDFHRKQRAARRRYQLELEEMEHRLSEMASSARAELEQLGLIVESHHHSATQLEEALKRTMSGASQLTTLLAGKEQQTAELRDLVSEVSKTLHHMVSKVDAETHRIDELEKRVEATRTSTGQLMDAESSLNRKGQDSKSMMHSIRKLENMVMRESDYRAAGIREVLEQVRGENAKKANEIESRWRIDLEEFEKRVEERVLRAVASAEASVQRETVAHVSVPSKLAHTQAPPRSILVVPPEFEMHQEEEQTVTLVPKPLLSASESKLEALEARFECSTTAVGSGTTSAELHSSSRVSEVILPVVSEESTTDRARGSAIDKLRDQLAGLRSELASGLEAPHKDRTDVSDTSIRSWEQSLLSETSQTHLLPPESLGTALGPVITLPVPSAPTMARASSTSSCHSLLAQPSLLPTEREIGQASGACMDFPTHVKLLHAKEPAVQVHNKWLSQGLQQASSEATLGGTCAASTPAVGLDIDALQAAPTMESVPTFSASPVLRMGLANAHSGNSLGAGWPVQGQASSGAGSQDSACLWSTGSRQLC